MNICDNMTCGPQRGRKHRQRDEHQEEVLPVSLKKGEEWRSVLAAEQAGLVLGINLTTCACGAQEIT